MPLPIRFWGNGNIDRFGQFSHNNVLNNNINLTRQIRLRKLFTQIVTNLERNRLTRTASLCNVYQRLTQTSLAINHRKACVNGDFHFWSLIGMADRHLAQQKLIQFYNRSSYIYPSTSHSWRMSEPSV